MVSLAVSAFICQNASVKALVHSMGPFFVGPSLVNYVSGANISLRFGHKSRYYCTMSKKCPTCFYPEGVFPASDEKYYLVAITITP